MVAMDTARGRTLEIAKHLYEVGSDGMSVGRLAVLTNQGENSEKTMLRFLRKIGAVEVFVEKVGHIKKPPRWRLTKRMNKIYRDIAQKDRGHAEN